MTLAIRLNLFKKHGVLILPEENCVAYEPEPDCVLIRIKSEGEFIPLYYPTSYVDILELQYDDVNTPTKGNVISREQIESVVNFFKQHRNRKLVVHCQAGISRSSATACAWGYFQQNKEIEEDIRSTFCFVPNARVYRSLVKEIEEQVWSEMLA